ncbi:hypothetical protein AB0C90_33190 [Streptomyces sp. NPDC048550]|uniref:hypothetical protein n=1 Tax=Streptomyces sp. NPDC048550 TaxID=3155739 RepID=UPI0034396A21
MREPGPINVQRYAFVPAYAGIDAAKAVGSKAATADAAPRKVVWILPGPSP